MEAPDTPVELVAAAGMMAGSAFVAWRSLTIQSEVDTIVPEEQDLDNGELVFGTEGKDEAGTPY